jgi:hypothetical protein
MDDQDPGGIVLDHRRPPELRHLERGFLDHCPVRGLGVADRWHFYRSRRGGVIALPAERHTRQRIGELFGEHGAGLLASLWPDPGALWNTRRARESLMLDARRAGLVDPAELGFRMIFPVVGSAAGTRIVKA